MDRTRFNEFKAEAIADYETKINKLNVELAEVRSLLMRMEQKLVDDANVRQPNVDLPIRKFNRVKMNRPQVPVKFDRALTVQKRMETALRNMNRDFQRHEFFEMVRNDETGIKSPEGTLSIYFAKMVKNNEVIVVQESIGNRSGIYRRAEDIKLQVEPSPATQENLL